MGLFGGIFNDSGALRQHCGQHQIHGGPHAGHIQVDLAALHAPVPGLGAHIALLHLHLGPQGGKALQVLVDGAAAEVAPAGQGHFRLAEPAQHGPQKVIAGPQLPPLVIGHRLAAHTGAVHLHSGAVDHPHLAAQLLQNVQQQIYIANLGDIFNAARALHQQGGGDNAYGGVFRAADFYLTIKRSPAMNHILFQISTSDSRPKPAYL